MAETPLETVVQRMMDAGESEEAIASVIRAFPTPSATWAHRAGMDRPASSGLSPTAASIVGGLQGAGGAILDMGEGAASELANAVFHGGDVIRRAVGMPRVIDRPAVQRAMHSPPTVAGQVGRFGADTAAAQQLFSAVPLTVARATAMGLPVAVDAYQRGGRFVANQPQEPVTPGEIATVAAGPVLEYGGPGLLRFAKALRTMGPEAKKAVGATIGGGLGLWKEGPLGLATGLGLGSWKGPGMVNAAAKLSEVGGTALSELAPSTFAKRLAGEATPMAIQRDLRAATTTPMGKALTIQGALATGSRTAEELQPEIAALKQDVVARIAKAHPTEDLTPLKQELTYLEKLGQRAAAKMTAAPEAGTLDSAWMKKQGYSDKTIQDILARDRQGLTRPSTVSLEALRAQTPAGASPIDTEAIIRQAAIPADTGAEGRPIYNPEGSRDVNLYDTPESAASPIEQAIQDRRSRVPASEIPEYKGHQALSGTPNVSIDEAQFLGIPANAKITNLDPKVLDKLIEYRAQKQSGHISDYYLNQDFKRASEE